MIVLQESLNFLIPNRFQSAKKNKKIVQLRSSALREISRRVAPKLTAPSNPALVSQAADQIITETLGVATVTIFIRI